MNVTRTRHSAFTMIEMMIVVGLLGVIVAMGMPSMIQAWHKEGMRKAVSDIVEACSHARANAILSASTVDLVFSMAPEAITVSVQTGAPQNTEDGSTPGPALSGTRFSVTLPNTIMIELLGVNFVEYQEEEQARVRFFANGTCDEFTILIRSDQNEWRKISLDVITAMADVEVIR